MTMRSSIRIGLIVLLALQLGGCSTIRDWMSGERSADSGSNAVIVPPTDRGVWVPLLPSSAPIRPTPYNGAGGQLEGLVAVIQEVDAVIRLVDIVSKKPAGPSAVSVNFWRIQADLGAVRAGLVEAVMQPRTAPRDWPELNADYRG